MLLPRARLSEMYAFCSPLWPQSPPMIPGTEWVPRGVLKEEEKKEKERKRGGKRRDEKKESDKYFRSDNNFGSNQIRQGVR